MTFTFQEQKQIGDAGEQFLDEYFRKQGFKILSVPAVMDRQGVDRIFIDQDDIASTIQYKTDHEASRTHKAFVEVVSSDIECIPGWAYTSKADVLMYYIPGDGLIYVVRFSALRANLKRWRELFREAYTSPNLGKWVTYRTKGVLVPLHEFEQIAEAVHSV